MRLGKVVKSNSHCDYIVQLDDAYAVDHPPSADAFGFGSFVKLEEKEGRHWAVGLVYNSQLINPQFLNNGPRLSSEPDPLFSPDLIEETRTVLGTVLIGTLIREGDRTYGVHGIPRVVVPVNTLVSCMSQDEIHHFHRNPQQQSQFCYYSHLLHCGGTFAAELTQQVLTDLVESGLFLGRDQRALEILCRELAWKTTMGAMR
ncbi:MAG: hypothetical protein EA367_15125 [Leptolyngbya sp. DLM2.Bin15]|nr:MAG: hypothetical protein EA367_15125 [Leptolyngbya sp. DLM2.Bin15]